MNRVARSFGVGAAAVLMSTTGCRSGDADLILTNANIYTLSWGEPDLEGVPAADAPFADGVWTPDAEAKAHRGRPPLEPIRHRRPITQLG